MNILVDAWYKKARWLALLRPLSFIYRMVSGYKRRQYTSGRKKAYSASIPVIVVGNINAGGTGKTPLVIYLALALQKAGFKPGIVSRGYHSKAPIYPFHVKPQSTPQEAGDEALLIAQNTHCPVIIDANRVNALKVLEYEYDCDVVLSDDGLQHYAMARDIEIVVVDGQRGFGNECLIPEGPLREKTQRLQKVDFIICNGASKTPLPSHTTTMNLQASYLCNLKTGARRTFVLPEIESAAKGEGLEKAPRQKVHALAGIGNPARFFTSLCACEFDIISHIFKDHHAFSKDDINFNDDLNVVMTEKDAIKCAGFASDKHWYLKVDAVLEDSFIEAFMQKVNALPNSMKP